MKDFFLSVVQQCIEHLLQCSKLSTKLSSFACSGVHLALATELNVALMCRQLWCQ